MTFGPGEDGEFGLGGYDGDGEADPEADVADEAAAELLGEPEQEYHTALPPKMEAWRKRSAAGAILTGFALGLQEALETKRQDPAIVVQTSGDPPRDLPIEADFEYGRPRQTVVSIRPWLLDGPGEQQDPEGPRPADGTGPSADGTGSSARGGSPSGGDDEAGLGKP